MHLPEIDKYAHLHSIFHSWDPRVKIVSLTLLIITIALLPQILLALVGFAIAVIFVFLSRIPFSFVLKQLRWVMLFLLFFFMVMPLTVDGNNIIKLKDITVSWEGLKLASLISLRAISICLLIFPMIGTTKFHESIKALHKLKFPNKLVQIIMFAYRYIFVFMEQFARMFTAAKARCFKKKTDFFTFKTIGNLIGMLFVRSFERTQSVYNAMISRGYKGDLKTFDEFKLCGKDLIKAIFILMIVILLNLARLII